ncbi:MAG: efflux transporter outer membrane subunit [Burkholderiales bacterium]|nr:efflux transporter outer membrane subunit [Burkholderiales bacterium]
MTTPLQRLLALAAAIALSGCAIPHRDAGAPALMTEQQINVADQAKLSRNSWPEAQWWTHYGDAQLNALEQQALAQSPALAAARARVEASRAQRSQVESSTGLFLGLTASLDRQAVSATGFLGPYAQNAPAAGVTGPWYTEGTVGLEAHYEVDLWGKDRARVDAALGLQNARQAEAAETSLLLSTHVAQVYWDIQSLNAALDLLIQARDIETEMVQAHTARAGRGLETKTAIEVSRVHALELDRQISATRGKIAVLREALRSLVAAGPKDLPEITPAPLPHDIGQMPDTLGYELLARRPDLQAMHWYLEASLRQIDAAHAAFYPSFDIKAFFGQDAIHLDHLMHRDSRQINLIPGLSLPLFDSGRLNAQLAGARAQRNLLVEQYNQSILDAVREIATAGLQLQNLDEQMKIEQAKLDALNFTAGSADAHYQRGLADKVAAREAKLPVLLEQGRMIELQSQQIDREIALTMALGGGYRAETQNAGR